MSDVSDMLHERIRTGNHETETQKRAERRRKIGTIIYWIAVAILIVPWFFPRYYIITVPIEMMIYAVIQFRYWVKHGVH